MQRLAELDRYAAHLAACVRLNDELNAFVEFLPAPEAPGYQANRALPLSGTLVAVKDVIHIAGHSPSVGSKAAELPVARRAASAIERLSRDGGHLLGRTQLVELAFGGWGTNRAVGTPVNPWSESEPLAPGGSSSGSAVALASGMADLALGTDTGGSVRIPAAFCGLTGLRPSPGRVPRDGMVHVSPSLDTIGPMARNVRDCWIGFAVLTSETAAGAAHVARRIDAVVSAAASLKGVRVAVVEDAALEQADGAVADRFADAVTQFEVLGAETARLRTTMNFAEDQAVAGAIIAYEAYRAFGGLVESKGAEMDHAVVSRVLAGRAVSRARYEEAQDLRRNFVRLWESRFREFDLLVLPTTPTATQPISSIDEDDLSPSLFTRFAGLADLCALALPMGFNRQDRPVSLQIVGTNGADEAILLAGLAFQTVTDWHLRSPPRSLPER